MKNNLSRAIRSQSAPRLRVLACLLGGATLLGGCVSTTERSLNQVSDDANRQAIAGLSDSLARESARLAATQAALQQAIEKKAPQPAPLPVPPQHDPLEDVVVTVKLQNAALPAILHVLSEQAKANILVDPEVLAIDKRASMYLNRVTARELYRHILNAFDLAGTTDGKTIKISLQEEKFFNIDFLNSRLDVDIAAGGNVFGSGASGGSGGGSGGDLIRGNVSLGGGTGKQVEPYDQLEANLKGILGTGMGKQDEEAAMSPGKPAYTLNRSSGTLYVKARPAQMRTVEKLIERNKASLKRQVLIEAQLLDVELGDGFQYGVDWNLLRNRVAATAGANPISIASSVATLPAGDPALPLRALTIPAQQLGAAAGRAAGIAYGDDNVFAALNVLRNFGNVKVLSNPSIRVRNNSPALLSVGTSSRFVAKSSVTVTNPGGGAATTTADVQTDSLFAGIIVGVVPFIGERGNIELLVHPMQTEVDAASLQLVDVGGGNRVTLPRVSYKGMTTTLNVNDGDTVILGGLIDQNSSNNDAGIPGLSDVPVLGRAFGAETASRRSRELIMVLKVKLL